MASPRMFSMVGLGVTVIKITEDGYFSLYRLANGNTEEVKYGRLRGD